MSDPASPEATQDVAPIPPLKPKGWPKGTPRGRQARKEPTVRPAPSPGFDLKMELFQAVTKAFPAEAEVQIKLLPLGHPKLVARRLGSHYQVRVAGLKQPCMMPVVVKQGEQETLVNQRRELHLAVTTMVPIDADLGEIMEHVAKLKGDYVRWSEEPAG